MNIYDFDDTIYDGDTCKDIIKYGLKKHPILTTKSLIKASILNKKYKKGLIEFEIVKETMLSFIFKIKNYKEFVNDFVNLHMKNIKSFYKERQSEFDVIVTASYELWINVFAEKIGIKHVIGTKTDDKGHIIGKNCKGEEKINRIKEEFPNIAYMCSYSDSSVDIPILELSNIAFVVEGNNLNPYVKGYKFKNNK